ncbi:unnamed protein product [Larinioides sclopetarius]|uniref:Uncharacterized protein n=1 Tax=Larinioides sclopetarius TaxID=280406 RepID=A0AAV2AGG9_9ARAC
MRAESGGNECKSLSKGGLIRPRTSATRSLCVLKGSGKWGGRKHRTVKRLRYFSRFLTNYYCSSDRMLRMLGARDHFRSCFGMSEGESSSPPSLPPPRGISLLHPSVGDEDAVERRPSDDLHLFLSEPAIEVFIEDACCDIEID